MSTPRVAAVHDLSGFGRCALTIVAPALSAMGIQCCPVPTALLSTHTGYSGNTFLDLSDEIAGFTAHWQALGLTFDGIYTGFLGSRRQVGLTEGLIRTFRRERTVVVVDPVLGDHGKPYRTCTPELCQGMASLARLADVIVPNRTEAAILLDKPYEAVSLDTEEACRRWTEALSLNGRRSVVLTGVSLEPGRIGAACFDRKTGKTEIVSASLTEGAFHGTGDLFASVLTGALVLGKPLAEAAALAADFTARCAARTAADGSPEPEGVDFEPRLWQLGAAVCENQQTTEKTPKEEKP